MNIKKRRRDKIGIYFRSYLINPLGLLCFISVWAFYAFSAEGSKNSDQNEAANTCSHFKVNSNACQKLQRVRRKETSKALRLKIPSLSKARLEKNKRELDQRRSRLMSAMTHKKIEKISRFIEKSNFDGAIRNLMKLKQSVKKRPYELAYVCQQLGLIYMRKDQYKMALKYINQALQLGALNKSDTLHLMLQLSYLHMMKENYVKSLTILNEWFYYKDRPPPDAYVLRANNYYELGYRVKALEQVEKALELTKLSIPRKKEWLKMASHLNFGLKNFSRTSQLLEELIGYYPNDRASWMHLATTYNEMKKTSKALATLEMAYKLGFLYQESEILNLVGLYLDQKIPLRAAKLLENEILKSKRVSGKKKNLEILANSYFYAEEKEKAIYFYRKAAKVAKDGRLYFYLGQMYMDMENWQSADWAFSKAFLKGGVKKDIGEFYLSSGIVKYRMGDKDLALQSFKKIIGAKNIKRSIQKNALEWVHHLEIERVSFIKVDSELGTQTGSASKIL